MLLMVLNYHIIIQNSQTFQSKNYYARTKFMLKKIMRVTLHNIFQILGYISNPKHQSKTSKYPFDVSVKSRTPIQIIKWVIKFDVSNGVVNLEFEISKWQLENKIFSPLEPKMYPESRRTKFLCPIWFVVSIDVVNLKF